MFESLFQQYENGQINQIEVAEMLDISKPVLSKYFQQRRIIGPSYDVNKKGGVYDN